MFVIAFAVSASAEVKPGDFITPNNAVQVQNLVSPGTYYKVQHGMTMKIIPTERIDWPPPYKEATEKYSQQVRLSPDHRTLVGYVAGQPFPLLDTNDPHVANKIIWNNVFKPMWSDDYDLRFYDCDTAYEHRGQQTRPIEYFQIGHYAGYDLVGRTEVQPMPIDPDFRRTGRYWLFGLYPVLAPEEIKGAGFIRYRYADPRKADDIWEYTPGAQRIRRLNESIMSSAAAPGTAAFSWDPDHYAGFNAKVEEADYRSWVRKTCSDAFTRHTRPRSDAQPMVAPAPAPKIGKCAGSTWSRLVRDAPVPRAIPRRSTPVPSSTWTLNFGSCPTYTPTTSGASCDVVIYTTSLIATARFPMRGLRSIRLSARL